MKGRLRGQATVIPAKQGKTKTILFIKKIKNYEKNLFINRIECFIICHFR